MLTKVTRKNSKKPTKPTRYFLIRKSRNNTTMLVNNSINKLAKQTPRINTKDQTRRLSANNLTDNSGAKHSIESIYGRYMSR